MKREEFNTTIESMTNINIFLINNGLKLYIPCQRCKRLIKLDLEKLTYTCRYKSNGMRCYFKKTISFYGILKKKSQCLRTYLIIIYEWSKNMCAKEVAFDLDLHSTTINRIYNKLNEVAAIVMSNTVNEIGGDNLIVEIDESKFSKRKYNRGRYLTNEEWVFGGVLRGDWSVYFFEFVKDRKMETLAEVITRKIAPGTIVLSDEWPAYRGVFRMLSGFDYVHRTVCHKDNWIDKETGTHTQNIEGFWSFIKREMRKYGTNCGDKKDMMNKMHSICFKRKYKRVVFVTIMKELIKH